MINSLRLQNFRSYKDESLEFEKGVNIIVGPNASGKTNLLEAILVACTGDSYRAKDVELVRFGQKWARLDAQYDEQPRSIKIKLNPDKLVSSKTFEISSKPYKRPPFEKTIPVVLFEPEHLQLLNGQPELRREFLDSLLEKTLAGYSQLRRQYQRTLRQRNALLKHGLATANKQIFAWDIRLSELGG